MKTCAYLNVQIIFEKISSKLFRVSTQQDLFVLLLAQKTIRYFSWQALVSKENLKAAKFSKNSIINIDYESNIKNPATSVYPISHCSYTLLSKKLSQSIHLFLDFADWWNNYKVRIACFVYILLAFNSFITKI